MWKMGKTFPIPFCYRKCNICQTLEDEIHFLLIISLNICITKLDVIYSYVHYTTKYGYFYWVDNIRRRHFVTQYIYVPNAILIRAVHMDIVYNTIYLICKCVLLIMSIVCVCYAIVCYILMHCI